jgi:hypothetical protein
VSSHDVLPLAVLELNGATLVSARFEDVLEGVFRAQYLAPVRDLQLVLLLLMLMRCCVTTLERDEEEEGRPTYVVQVGDGELHAHELLQVPHGHSRRRADDGFLQLLQPRLPKKKKKKKKKISASYA